MRITEVTDTQSAQQIAALSQFLISRAEDTGTEKTMALPRFIELLKDMGVSVNSSALRDMIQQPPLNNLIQNIEGDDDGGRVIFKGGPDDSNTMSVDQARKTVDSMAKRAAGPALK